MTQEFDPDAPALAGAGIFGLQTTAEAAGVRVLGLPFDATTSYRSGTAKGPAAIVAASHQVDLFDPQQASWRGGDGRPWARGIHHQLDDQIAAWNEEARCLASPIIERGGRLGSDGDLARDLERVNEIGALVNDRVRSWARERLEQGALPVLIGGDHSVPFGAIDAAAQAHPGLGLLHIDAHADLREAYEGFRWSHASILDNVLTELPGVAQVLSVGLRDVGEAEAQRIVESEGRVQAVYGHDWAKARGAGENLAELAGEAIARLPQDVWLTIDIDGLDPSLCPNTGTPVPGGLTWDETLTWLACLVNSGRRIVGFDLCEVNPGTTTPPGSDSWDAIVGARLLYKGIGAAVASRS